MTLDEVKKHYKSSYAFNKATGMAANCWNYWRKRGYIPIVAQKKIQDLTNGELKLSWEDLKQ